MKDRHLLMGFVDVFCAFDCVDSCLLCTDTIVLIHGLIFEACQRSEPVLFGVNGSVNATPVIELSVYCFVALTLLRRALGMFEASKIYLRCTVCVVALIFLSADLTSLDVVRWQLARNRAQHR